MKETVKKIVIHILIVAALVFIQFLIINSLENNKENWNINSNEDNFVHIELEDFYVKTSRRGRRSSYYIVDGDYKYRIDNKYLPRIKRNAYLEQIEDEEMLDIIYVPSSDPDDKTYTIVELRSDDTVYISYEEQIKNFRSQWVNDRIGFAILEFLYLVNLVVYVVTAKILW